MTDGIFLVTYLQSVVMKHILLSSVLFLLLSGPLSAQLANYVFGIDNPSSGVFWFSKTDVTTGVHTQLTQVPIGSYGSGSSSCVDMTQQLYMYCSGRTVYKLDPVSGTLVSTVQLTLPATSTLSQTVYNPCDSMIYGVVNNNPNPPYLAQYNPYTDVLTAIGNLPASTIGFCLGCMSVIDPINGRYIMHDGGSLHVIDIATGQLLFSTPVINLSSEVFGHIAYDCASGQIVGTSANQNEDVKFLASVDVVTGVVTHISGFSWPQGWWKPSCGGNCIDFATGTYYYSGAPDLLIGVNIATGDTTAIHATGQGTFLFVQCFSQCPCSAVAIEEAASFAFSVYPNPANEVLIAECGSGVCNEWLIVTDAAGREVIRTQLSGSRTIISVEQLAPGVYFWRNESDHSQGKFVRSRF